MIPKRGFDDSEYRARVAAAQARMDKAGLAALLLTAESDIRYFTGFLTRFWDSPVQPWSLILPAKGEPVAVIPEIGVSLMRRCWIGDIRPFAPAGDDGVGLLADTLAALVPAGGAVGLPSGAGSRLGMPLHDWRALRDRLPDRGFGDDAGILQALRLIKSPAEIAKIRWACGVADGAFARMDEIAGDGIPLSEVFRAFQILCLEDGADAVPALSGAAGPGGYDDVIAPASDTPLAEGDVLMLATGLSWDGYVCDFNLNFTIGDPAPDVQDAHARLIEATHAGFDAARPGATPAELYAAMDYVLTGGTGAGPARMGHGLGLSPAEPPAILPADHRPLAPGMVLSLAPVIGVGPGRIMMHKENIVVTRGGAEWLSTPTGQRIARIEP